MNINGIFLSIIFRWIIKRLKHGLQMEEYYQLAMPAITIASKTLQYYYNSS